MTTRESATLVFYVEDDENIRDLTLYALRQAGFEGRGFPDADAFFAACADDVPALVLLDIMLPGTDGLGILARLRADTRLCDVPVIMLTAKGTEFDTISGLDAGADDYLAKPFSMMELISRANALLRRARRAPVTVRGGNLVYDSIVLDPHARRVEVGGRPVDLTFKEFELLRVLMENPGHALSRAQLFEEVWGSEFVGVTRTVDVHMQTLRQKLEQADPGSSSALETVRGIGYRLRLEDEA